MMGIKSCGTCWKYVVAVALIVGMGSASAGPEEDFANGMISYRRGGVV